MIFTKKQVNAHDLPAIFHYWSDKYLSPTLGEIGIKSIPEFFAKYLLLSAQRTGVDSPVFISIGSGNCDLEIEVAKELLARGLHHFKIQCLEISSEMLARGEVSARQINLQNHFEFIQADFNTWHINSIYDGVMANQSLHHVTELEHLFLQLKRSLHEDGSFVISDMVGRNGQQRWPEALSLVHKYWTELPKEKNIMYC